MAADDGTREFPVKPWERGKTSEPEPALPGWAVHEETVNLPAFIKAPAPPAPTRKAPPDISERLPSSERGMLIFVSAILALGTLAIVAMATVGR